MIAYKLFLCTLLSLALSLGLRAQFKTKQFILVWVVTSILAGGVGLYVPWRVLKPDRIGFGAPIPVKVWRNTRYDTNVSLEFPLSLLENCIAIFAVGSGSVFAARKVAEGAEWMLLVKNAKRHEKRKSFFFPVYLFFWVLLTIGTIWFMDLFVRFRVVTASERVNEDIGIFDVERNGGNWGAGNK